MKIMVYHVLPINDLKEHEETSSCDCNPTVEITDGGIIIIHNSYDLREVIEDVNEILK